MSSQRFCLRWNNHQSNLLSVFDQLLHDESFVDVTLAVEGQLLKAHKMILSACSPYFQTLFVGHPDGHPIVILKDVPYADMRSLLDFMYRGEVSVDQDRLTAFLKVAESLRIKGLTEVNEERCDIPSIASSLLQSPTPSSSSTHPNPPPHLHRIHHPSSSHKRGLPPMAANPLLGSALTAPKRKRGRPRKLSGGGLDSASTESRGIESRGITSDSNSRGGDSPLLHHATQPELLEVNMGDYGGAESSPPPALPPPEVRTPPRHEDDVEEEEEEAVPPSGDEVADGSNLNSSSAENIVIKEEKIEPMPSTSMNDSTGNFKPGSQEEERFVTPVSISMEKPSTATTNEMSSTTTTTTTATNLPPPEEETKMAEETTTTTKNVAEIDNNNDFDNDDDEERYEDMIACSPANSSDYDEEMGDDPGDASTRDDAYDKILEGARNFNNNSINNQGRLMLSSSTSITPVGGVVVDMTMKKERDDYLDEDISQYEMDSFRSIMSGVVGGSSLIPGGSSQVSALSGFGTTVTGMGGTPERFNPNKPIDKASVRRYCTHEAENVYRCNVCAKTYTHISNFCRHFLSAHHGVRQEIPCPVCFKLFTRKDNMMTHTKQVHRLAIMRGIGGGYQQQSSESGSPSFVPTDGTSQDSC